MTKRNLASAVLIVGMGLTSCQSTSSTHSPNNYRAQSSAGSLQSSRSDPDTRVARATSPRYIPPASPKFTTPAEPPRPVPMQSRPLVLPGEKLIVTNSKPPSYSKKVNGTEWVSLERWGKLYKGWYGRIQKGSQTIHRLVVSGMRFDLLPKRRLITCQGMQIWMGFGPEMIGDNLFVHHLDNKKHLAPLAAGKPILGRVAVIDAGHGKNNQGTRSVFNKAYEKDYVLDWALRLKPLLERKGWRVFLTRTADEGMSLTERVKFADQVKASLFISLHLNAASRPVRGLETYCIAPVGMPSHLTRGNPDPVSFKLPNNPWDAASFQLAARVHNQVLLKCRMTDRGVRRVRFMSVIKGQKRPAILVEGGYLSNPTEAQKIDQKAYRQKLAEGIAAAL